MAALPPWPAPAQAAHLRSPQAPHKTLSDNANGRAGARFLHPRRLRPGADVAKAFAGLLPAGHPAIGPLLGNPSATPLPAWHPPLDQMVTRINFGNPAAAVSVLAAHPPIDAAYAKGTALPSSHPDIGKLPASALPPSHPDVNAMFANPAAHPLPAWHPAIENYVRRVIGANHTVSVTLSLRLETVVSFDEFKQRKLRKAMADGGRLVVEGDYSEAVAEQEAACTAARPRRRGAADKQVVRAVEVGVCVTREVAFTRTCRRSPWSRQRATCITSPLIRLLKYMIAFKYMYVRGKPLDL